MDEIVVVRNDTYPPVSCTTDNSQLQRVRETVKFRGRRTGTGRRCYSWDVVLSDGTQVVESKLLHTQTTT